jgi:hypothetical protein
MNRHEIVSILFVTLFFSNILLTYNVEACKDIVACGDATAGEYNLLLKVRDPSRSGLQVLCIVPEGYEYTYRYPWTGKPLKGKVMHKFIGVATEGDTIPNIVKAGMTLTDAGLAFGDADTDSRWINPTKHAWDDFDWIRYACEKADNEDHATSLLTKDAVTKMHATGVSENLFIIGPKKGVVIEADAFHYDIKEFENGIVVMANYPKELWKTQRINTFFISRSFNTVVEKYVRNRGAIRLNSLYGIRIVEIGDSFICVKPIFFLHALRSNSLGIISKINLGERKTVGYFSVELLDITGNKAKVRVSNKFKAWEEKILEHIQPKYGSITLRDMINWSRLHAEDLDDLRPMCQDFYEFESVAIYKIPKENYEIMSTGWYSPNHACSSIFVPFHICNTDIYNNYETGQAAELSLKLFNEYGHGKLEASFSNVEEVFLNEMEVVEQIAIDRIDDIHVISDFLTTIDIAMQKQAFMTEEIWLEINKISNQQDKQAVIEIINGIWYNNYSTSLKKMKNSIDNIKMISNNILNKICDIGLNICKSRIDAANALSMKCSSLIEEYKKANQLIKKGDYSLGFDYIYEAFNKCDIMFKGQILQNSKNTEIPEKINTPQYFFTALLIVGISLFIIMGLKQKR